MRSWAAGLVAQHGDEAINAITRVNGCGLLAGGGVIGAPYLLGLMSGKDHEGIIRRRKKGRRT